MTPRRHLTLVPDPAPARSAEPDPRGPAPRGDVQAFRTRAGSDADAHGRPDSVAAHNVAPVRDLAASVARHPAAHVASRNETPVGLTALNGPDGRS